ncbi:MAG: TylF/MycF/NovP-related O-methyltransferase [bacterium]|nr:TylF/MycF/NovP-related O-methyltransferase [bacterium]
MKNTRSHQVKLNAEGTLRKEAEKEASQEYARIFEQSLDTTEDKLHHFLKYVRRQDLTRLLARYEIFKKVLHTKGSIVECGVYRGFGLFAWALFSEILEPVNLTRRIYGFDTFSGFSQISDKDANSVRTATQGDLAAFSYEELQELIKTFDKNRFLGHIEKIRLIKGSAVETIPQFVKENPHLVVSLLFLDFDVYEPTKIAIESLVPRMPKGSIIAFDELDNSIWPGETQALLDTLGINNLKIQRLEFDPYIGYAIIE